MLLEVLLTLCFIASLYVLRRRWKYDVHRIPSPPGLPLLGHTLDFVAGSATVQAWKWFREAFRELDYPPILRVNQIYLLLEMMLQVSRFGTDSLIVRDTTFVKSVMNSKHNPFPRSGRNGDFFLPLVGNDPTVRTLKYRSTMTPYLKAYRRMFTVSLSSSNLSRMMPMANKTVDRMMDIVEQQRLQKGAVDFQSLLSRFSLDIIGQLAFDVDLGALDQSRPLHDDLANMLVLSRARFRKPFLKMYNKMVPWSRSAKAFDDAVEALNGEWAWLLREIRNKKAPSDGEMPMWWQLRNLEDLKTGQPLDDKNLRTELASVVLVGMETTAQQLAWILSLLASHPRIVDALMQEFEERELDVDGGDVSFQDLAELPYLSAVIKEGMRIAYIASGTLIRVVPDDMTILGYRVPKGTMISAVGTRSVATEAEWGDPDVFRPERWMTDEDMSSKYSLGFSFGARDCVGQRLGVMEMKLVIVKLMRRYRLELEGDWRELLDRSYESLTIKAKNGIWIRLTPKTDTKFHESLDGATKGCNGQSWFLAKSVRHWI